MALRCEFPHRNPSPRTHSFSARKPDERGRAYGACCNRGTAPSLPPTAGARTISRGGELYSFTHFTHLSWCLPSAALSNTAAAEGRDASSCRCSPLFLSRHLNYRCYGRRPDGDVHAVLPQLVSHPRIDWLDSAGAHLGIARRPHSSLTALLLWDTVLAPASTCSNNMLFPKESKAERKLLFVCRRCNYEQDADTPVVYRHELVRSAV